MKPNRMPNLESKTQKGNVLNEKVWYAAYLYIIYAKSLSDKQL